MNLLEVRQRCSPEGTRPPPAPGHTACPPYCHLPYGLAKISPPRKQLFSHALFTRTQLSGPHLPRTHKRGPGGPHASKHIEFSGCEPYLSRELGTPRKRINTQVLTESKCVSVVGSDLGVRVLCVYIYICGPATLRLLASLLNLIVPRGYRKRWVCLQVAVGLASHCRFQL